MEPDSSEIKALRRIVWRTAIAGRVERFGALLNDPESQKYFGDEFINKLSSKVDRLFRLQIVLAAIYSILMLSLFAAQDPKKSEFQILGYGFKNLGYYKEFLLFAAALLTPTSSIVSAYHRYLSELRNVALRKLIPYPDVREFATHIYSDTFVDSLVKDRKLGYRRPHGVTTLLVAIFGIALVALALALLAASFVLQISVIYDVANNPSSTPYLNAFIVAFALGAIALSWLISALQLPLPEVDLESSVKLSELQKRDSAKYQETMKRIAVESARRERVWSIAAGVAIFTLVYALFAALLLHPTQSDLWKLFFISIPGLALTVFISTTVPRLVKRAIYRSYFRKYPEGSDPELKAFARATRLVGACRVVVLVAGSLLYSLLALRSK